MRFPPYFFYYVLTTPDFDDASTELRQCIDGASTMRRRRLNDASTISGLNIVVWKGGPRGRST